MMFRIPAAAKNFAPAPVTRITGKDGRERDVVTTTASAQSPPEGVPRWRRKRAGALRAPFVDASRRSHERACDVPHRLRVPRRATQRNATRSADRGAKHPEQHLAGYAGLMQADAYAGFNRLYDARRRPGPIIEAACWAHARRKFFELARLDRAPIASEAVERIDALFAIEREINGMPPQERLRVRQERSRPLIIELQTWLREQRARLSRNNDTKRSTTASTAGTPSPASSMMGAFACRITPPSGNCVRSR